MVLYTIGFTKKSARQFFELIRSNNIDMLVDIRLNNKSQLAGFSKEEDLRYFLEEICHCPYQHCAEYAPTSDILDAYKKKRIPWEEYATQYVPLMQERNVVADFFEKFGGYEAVCLLCSEPTPECCHRRLLAEMIVADHPEIVLKHI